MAFVIKRPNGRWELRESWVSPAGPRARTLASFRLMTPAIGARAAERSTAGLSVEAVMHLARAAGAPVADTRAEEVARELIELMSAGAVIPGALQRQLQIGLTGSSPPPAERRAVVPDLEPPPGGVSVRTRVIASAIECFRTSGVRHTRMSDIADHAGIARPNI